MPKGSKRGASDASNLSDRAGIAVSALGIVFGDIGTSPLYTLKTVLDMSGGNPQADTALGSLSLILWTLIMVTSVKYVIVAMRIDNDGEGGILALMALLGTKQHRRPMIVAAGLFGAALIYGDGAITPAISVLSAIEGLNLAAPTLKPYILPISIAILVALFGIQPLGTSRIGKAFGPIMGLWFFTIAVLGAWGIVQHPSVLIAINPLRGLHYLFSNGYSSFLVLGGVFLCVTGAEALYADMGQFGRGPIRLAWSAIVLPSLVLSYAGQTAIVMEGAPVADNIFYRLCPGPFLIPFVILATLATIIASQSIITGAFSMTRQAIQLGWLPRLRITQTSEAGYGQIYVGVVNWLLMIVTIGLTLFFGQSSNLASAFGIAVSATMLLTSVLLYIAMREVWGWGLFAAGTIAGLFLCIDSAFFLANIVKIVEGGYVPLLLASVVYGTMLIWHHGSTVVSKTLGERLIPIDEFLASVASRNIPRVPGAAVFLTRTLRDTPPVMVWHVNHNRALHAYLLVLNVEIAAVPWVGDADRLSLATVAPNCWRARVRYGFMERPDVPAMLDMAHQRGCSIPLDDVTYYIGHAIVVHREDGTGLPAWETALFSAMERNAHHVTDFFKLPSDNVVESGRQLAI
ncbi:MAG: KUP/HAK/KT family potassium transporter [Gammaproteobacteria bacterium]|nr:KUP/HAK/KT family potassium transporter [Gammaproteobacteria bacterium]